ncbi:MAG TPA: TetR/AcrR family transcriptional regulator [Alphaproteobacteria bacterium]|nr:TetR/AcrR family transcriptional regulator [Alphaproteobacteria bacterium]
MAGSRASSETAEKIAIAAVQLSATRGWRALSLAEIAAEAGVTLAELARCYGNRPQILDGFERMVDTLMLSGASPVDTGEAQRDRLFEIIMARLDALQPYRDGLRRIARELPMDPPSSFVLTCALPRSVAWMYAGAGIRIGGPLMPLRLAALGAAYVATLRAWFGDESPDLAKTMAALDRELNRIERVLGGKFGRSRPAAAVTEPPSAEPDVTPGPSRRSASRTRAPRRRKQA